MDNNTLILLGKNIRIYRKRRGMTLDQLAEKMNVTVDNLYNIHRRALLQLRILMGRKEDYYD